MPQNFLHPLPDDDKLNDLIERLDVIIKEAAKVKGETQPRGYGIRIPGFEVEMEAHSWYGIWREQSQGDNYRATVMAFGRLEIYLVWPVNKSGLEATSKTLTSLMRQIVARMRKYRQNIGLLQIKHYGHELLAVPGHTDLVQSRIEAEMLVI